MRSAGVKVMLVFEVSTSDPDGGYAQGVAYAQRAKAGADYLGYKGVIFFCNDRPALPSVSSWQAYLDGAASVLGKDRIGAYGFKDSLNAARGHAVAFWQSGRQSDLVPHAGLYQWNNGSTKVSGITCDINYVYTDYTLAAPTGGGSAPASTPKEEDMPYTRVSPSTDGYVVVPTFGGTKLYVGAAYGRAVNCTEIWHVGPSPASGGNYLNNGAGQNFAADRPGPVPVTAGAVSVTLRYTADHEFSVWITN